MKRGKGNQIDSSDWQAIYDEKKGEYYVRVSSNRNNDVKLAIYLINKSIYDKLGTFPEDDYMIEDMIIRNGTLLYKNYKRNGKIYLLFIKNGFKRIDFAWAFDFTSEAYLSCFSEKRDSVIAV